jgi:hypothetical protein
MEITFFQKSQIHMALLASKNFDEGNRRQEFHIRGSVIDIQKGVGVHECLSKHTDSSVKCTLTLKLEDNQDFNLQAQYHIIQVNPSPVDFMKIALCPHQDVERHLANIGQYVDTQRRIRVIIRNNGRPPRLRQLGPISSYYFEPGLFCPSCFTWAWDVWFSNIVSSKIRTVLTVSRWFGSNCYGEANAAWYRNTTRSLERMPMDQ